MGYAHESVMQLPFVRCGSFLRPYKLSPVRILSHIATISGLSKPF